VSSFCPQNREANYYDVEHLSCPFLDESAIVIQNVSTKAKAKNNPMKTKQIAF